MSKHELKIQTFFSALQNQVADLKEMNSVLKKEIAELEKKLAYIRGVRNFISSYPIPPS